MADGSLRLVRPADLLVATLELDNLVVAPDGRQLVRVTSGAPASVVLSLPPQHYLEPAVRLQAAQAGPQLGVDGEPVFVVALLAGGGARFEWQVPDGIQHVDIGDGPGGLLEAIARLPHSPGGTLIDALVNLWFGHLDIPWSVSASPADSPDAALTQHPLWRISAALAPGEVLLADTPLQWAVPQQLDVVLATSRPLDHDSSRRLLTTANAPDPAGVTLSNPFPYFRRAFLFRQITATALGGTMSFVGPAPAAGASDPGAFDYEHRTSLGRDVCLRNTVWGWLSTGHRAAVTTYVDRRIRSAEILNLEAEPNERTVTSTLLASAVLVVTEPVLDLSALAGEYAHGGHEMPFTELRIGTSRVDIDVLGGHRAHPLTRDSTPVSFDLTGVDHAGRSVELRLPLCFLPDGLPAAALSGLVPAGGTPASLTPAAVALAPEDGRPPGSTSVTVAGLSLLPAAGTSRPVLPAIGSLQVGIDALAGLVDPVPVVPATLSPLFLGSGLDRGANPVGALLSFPPQQLALPTANIGGLGNPGGIVDLITAERGAVPAALAAGPPSLDQIKAAFPLPKLLGTINLQDLLSTDSFPAVGGLPSVPQLSRTGPRGAETLTYHFEAGLQQPPAGSMVVVGTGARLVLDATICVGGDGAAATSHGAVTGLGIELADMVTLRFAQILFTTSSGGATSVTVEGAEVDFGGALEFLAEIARRLAGLGGGAGPRVDVDRDGVTAGFQLAIPAVAVGVAELSNLVIAAFLRVPFTSGPVTFTLDVASKERPFQVAVSMFGGGGYLALELTPAGLRSLEASIEFGGSMSLDIVVASGGVSVQVGIFFGLQNQAGVQTLAFAAFVRASGQLTVLGLVSIFVEFRLQLTYSKISVGGSTHALLSGTASVTVGVKVLFFSKSVTLTVTRSFIGSATDPTFADCIEPADWDTYCLAFAGAGAPVITADPFGSGAPA
jgi:hypothetical protein